MTIVTLHLSDVKAAADNRPGACPYCANQLLQRWGSTLKEVKDTHTHQAIVYRYRCTECQRTFRHYPQGVTAAHQSQRLVQFAALCWVFGLSLRGTSAILSVFPAVLSHTSAWRDVQAVCAGLKRRLPGRVRVLGVDGFYPKIAGQEQATIVAVDLGSGQPLALGAINEKDWRAVVAWLAPLVEAWGVEVIVSDDLKELDMATRRLGVAHQVCHFHLLRWLWRALAELRKQVDLEWQATIDEIWQIARHRPPEAPTRLFELWQGIPVRRSQDHKTSPLYRLRLLILRLSENWDKYSFDQTDTHVPPTNNGTERAIGKWRIRSHSARGFKSWAGLDAAFLLCGSIIA